MKKALKIIFVILIILGNLYYFGINYAIDNIFPYSIIRPSRTNIEEYEKRHPGKSSPSSYNLKWNDISITVEDTLILKGWYIFTNSKQALGTIFMLHGISSCRASQLQMASVLADEGFNVVLYDARAHGYSGGINCTYGYNEVKDLSRLIDSVAFRFPKSAPFAVFGHSLGASVGVQALAADKRLVCGVFEAPFANLKEIVRDYFAQKIYFRINSIPDASLKTAGRIAGFNTESIDPAISAKSIYKPVMIVHGVQDKKVSPSYGKRIFDNIPSRNKIWYPVFRGDHNNLNETGGKNLRLQIISFYKNYMDQTFLNSN